MLQLDILEGQCTGEVEHFVSMCSNSMVYHTPAFMRLISRETGSEPIWIICRRAGILVGVLPLMLKHGSMGPVVNSLAYFGSYGGVLTQCESDAEVATKLLDGFADFCFQRNVAASTIIENPLQQFDGLYENRLTITHKDSRIGQFTELSGVQSPDELINKFDKVRKRNINKAAKLGIETTKSEKQWALDFLFETHTANISSIGGLTKSKQFFESALSSLGEQTSNIFIAQLNGKAVAGLLVLYHKNTAEYFTPVIKEEYRNTQALPYLIYQAMIDATDRGIKLWNWGGTWASQTGVYSFKKKWATRDIRYSYFVNIINKKMLLCGRDEIASEYPNFYVVPFTELSK